MSVTFSSIAIVIPTLNRHEFVCRTLLYYANLGFNLNIFVGDSSSKPILLPLDISSKISRASINYQYFHLPGLNDRQAITFLVKKVQQLGLPYVCFQGDDDYFVPETLLDCSSFLHSNPDFSSAQGNAYLFSLNQSGPFGTLKNICSYWHQPSLSSNSSLDRLREFIDSYFVLQFSLHRTSEFVESCEFYERVPDLKWGELFHCFYLALQGKSFHIDKPFLFRNSHPGINHESFFVWRSSIDYSYGLIFTYETLSRYFTQNAAELTHLRCAIETHLNSSFLIKSSNNTLRPSLVFNVAIKRISSILLRFLCFIDKNCFSIPRDFSLFLFCFKRIMLSFSIL